MTLIERTEHDVYPYISPDHNLKNAAAGKTVVITGGGQGCGRAMTEYFGLAGAARVYIAGRTASALEDTKSTLEAKIPGFSVIPVVTDVTQEASVQQLFDRISSRGFVPDVLINNSGTNLSPVHIVDSDPIKWWTDIEVSVKGTYLCTRAMLKLLAARGNPPAVILNISSGVSDVDTPTMSAYAPAKVAVNKFTEIVQRENADKGIRCIAMSPGGIAGTGLSAAMGTGTSSSVYSNRLLDTVDLAGAFAVYLTTPAAEFLAGRYAIANWDVEKLEGIKDEIVEQNLLKGRMVYGDKPSAMLIGRDGKPVALK